MPDIDTYNLLRKGWAGPHVHACTYNPRFRLWRHITHIGRLIGTEVAKGDARILINLGPRWGKSELVSVATPTWFLSRYPDRRVIMASASQALAKGWGQRNRDNFTEHPELGVVTREDSDAKADWLTTAGGGMRSVGIGTAVLGFGAHLLIIDDPYGEWKDAQSVVYRKGVEDWYTATATSRLEPGASVIVLHHRMHPLDLSAFLLKGEDAARWIVVSLPSIATGPDVLGRKLGESLDPVRWTEEQLEQKRREMRGMWEPMHQQNPMALGAGAAYKHFGQHNIDKDLAYRPDLPLHLSFDFNVSPGMHVLMGHHDRMTDLAWAFDEIHAQSMNVAGACAEVRRRVAAMAEKPEAIHIYGDCGGNARSIASGETHWDAVVRGLNPLGIPVRHCVADPAPAVVERVGNFNYAMRDVGGEVWYKVHPRCEALVRDLTSVQLDDKGGIDKSDPLLTHASEAEGHRMYVLRGFRIPFKREPGTVYMQR